MTNSRQQCWLHIGAPKTGSTAIQQFLSANREALAAAGFGYPAAAWRAGGHHDLAFLVGGGYPDWAIPQARSLDDLIAELRAEIAVGPPATILSSENFYLLCEPVRVFDLLVQLGFSADAVRVVVYLRRQDEAIASWYNQAVKAQGYAGSLDEHRQLHRGLWDYAERLGAWAAVFGKQRLFVRRYEPQRTADGDIRRDFVQALGLPAETLVFSAGEVNTRINRDILEFQRLLNRLPCSPQEKRQFHRRLIELTALSQPTGLFSDAPLLDSDRRRQIAATYAASNRRVADAYFGGQRLFEEVAAPEPEQAGVPPGLTVEKLAGILGWLIVSRDRETMQRNPS